MPGKVQGMVMSRAAKIDPQFCCFRLRVGQSKIHGRGVYADQDIPPNRKVIEYRGEKIDVKEGQKRRCTPYLFVLDQRWMLDGAVNGSGARVGQPLLRAQLGLPYFQGAHYLYEPAQDSQRRRADRRLQLRRHR